MGGGKVRGMGVGREGMGWEGWKGCEGGGNSEGGEVGSGGERERAREGERESEKERRKSVHPAKRGRKTEGSLSGRTFLKKKSTQGLL